MTKRKRGIDLVNPPRTENIQIPEGYKELQPPLLVMHSYHRVLWVIAEKEKQTPKGWLLIAALWILTDREGEVKDTFIGLRADLPAKFKRVYTA